MHSDVFSAFQCKTSDFSGFCQPVIESRNQLLLPGTGNSQKKFDCFHFFFFLSFVKVIAPNYMG